MERPRDDHKLTHNMRLATRDKLFGGTVSRLQVRRCWADVALSNGWCCGCWLALRCGGAGCDATV